MSDTLIVFAKAPVPGQVKTRLVPPLTPAQAAQVHDASLHDVVERARSVAATTLLSYGPGKGAEDFFGARFPDFRRMEQQGADLGARLHHAADQAFNEGAQRVCIIGSDSPTLPIEFIQQSFQGLDSADVVLGPTEDGGYYLVGIHSAAWPRAAGLFDGIPWSTSEVLSSSMVAARNAGITVTMVPEWFDVDHAEDLRRAAGQALGGSRISALLSGSSEIARRIGLPPSPPPEVI